jgi:hypothetical protein
MKPQSRGFAMKKYALCLGVLAASLGLGSLCHATTITAIRPGVSPVPLYDRFEVEFDLSTTYVNPFDPDEIDALLVIEPPSGGPVTIPAFWYQEYERSSTGTDEILTAIGEPCWVARFTPTETGVHTYHIEVTDSEGTGTSDDATFTCETSADRGYVRPDPSDFRMFTFDDDSYYFPVGENVCWASNLGTYDYDVYFGEMEASGQNWTRIWMTDFYRGQSLEWNQSHWTGYFHGLGVYSLECAWKIDYVVELARQKGIYLQLVTQHHGQFSTTNYPQWDQNPYNTANGGMLSSPEEFFTNADAKDLYKRKTRYTVARWGYATSILCWEFWNEVGYTDAYNATTVASWHEEMAQYVESIDPWDHMLTTSVSAHNWQVTDPVWSLPEMDCTQLHLYVSEITNTTRSKIMSMWTHNKPVIVGEFGCNPTDNRFTDPDGTHIHNGIWSAAMTMTGAMTWWWDDYIHPNDLYYHYAGLSAFFEDEDLRDPTLDVLSLTVTPSTEARGYGIGEGTCAYVWIQDPDNVMGGSPGGPLSGVTLDIPGMTTGTYNVEYWNTFLGVTTGTEVITCGDGTLHLDIPDFSLDIALKARWQGAAPPTVTDFAASPGYNRVHLSWTNPGSDFDHVVVVRKAWSASSPYGYPDYPHPAAGYPTDPADGIQVYSGTGTSHDDVFAAGERTIYFYRAFAYGVGSGYNGGTAPTGELPGPFGQGDRCTNYWLGDVDSDTGPGGGDYDGDVDFEDISVLTAAYRAPAPLAWPENDCDVGPTDDNSPLGIPQPDDSVNFEDLMVFAMNFDVVGPLGSAGRYESSGAGTVKIEIFGPPELPGVGEEFVARIALTSNRGEVKGICLVLTYDEDKLVLVEAPRSCVLTDLGRWLFFTGSQGEAGEVWIDMAILGTGQTIPSPTDLASLRFAVKGESDTRIDFDKIDLRGADNKPVAADGEGIVIATDARAPSLTCLLGADPNPFTQGTAVHYQLDQGRWVAVRIFDAQGRLVRTLVDGSVGAGRQTAAWDGRDGRNRQVPAGVYFVKMTAGSYEHVSKTVRLR